MGTRSTLAKLSREVYPGLDVIDQDFVVAETGLVPGSGISATAGAHKSWK